MICTIIIIQGKIVGETMGREKGEVKGGIPILAKPYNGK